MKELIISIIIGLIQGITEVLPISSSAHNAIIHYYFFNSSINLTNEIFLHVSSTIAVVLFLRKDILDIIKKIFNKDFEYLIKLILGTIPAFLIYLLFHNYIKRIFSSLLLIGFFLIITSFILLLTTTFYNKKLTKKLTYSSSISIGLCQSLALLPGISRSGMTLFGGITNKISPKETIKFSFFLYLISSIGSCVLDYDNLINIDFNIYSFITSIITLLSTFICLKFLYNKFTKKHFYYFSAYTFTLGLIIIILNILGK